MSNQKLLSDLAKAKAVFQLRAIQFAMGMAPPEQCPTCGDHHEPDSVPYACQTGDGA